MVGSVNVPDLVDTDDEGDNGDCVNNSVDVDSCSDNSVMSDSAADIPSKPPSTPSKQPSKPPLMPDPKPKWLAVFHVKLNRGYLNVLGDSGCSGSCMSLDYFRKNPHLKQSFAPTKSKGTAINGSAVPSIGEVKLKFAIGRVAMTITCKVIEGLMDPLILGWDWMCKYSVLLDAANGKLHFSDSRSRRHTVPLMENAFSLSGCYYRAFEDLVLPPFSKVHANVELILDGHSFGKVKTAVTEPFESEPSFWAARSCAKTDDNRFMTDFINSTGEPVKIKAGHVIGYASFVNDAEFDSVSSRTNMFCSYRKGSICKQPDYDEATSDAEQSGRQPDSHAKPTVRFDMGASSFPEDSAESESPDVEIPPGAKPLEVDYSKVAEDARPYVDRIRHLVENKHAKAFSKHDRDYGKTTLVEFRAHLKDANITPIASPAYRTRPEMREVIDRQAEGMIAAGLVWPSKSPFAAPILLARKKCGGWRFITDFRKNYEQLKRVNAKFNEDMSIPLEKPKKGSDDEFDALSLLPILKVTKAPRPTAPPPAVPPLVASLPAAPLSIPPSATPPAALPLAAPLPAAPLSIPPSVPPPVGPSSTAPPSMPLMLSTAAPPPVVPLPLVPHPVPSLAELPPRELPALQPIALHPRLESFDSLSSLPSPIAKADSTRGSLAVEIGDVLQMNTPVSEIHLEGSPDDATGRGDDSSHTDVAGAAGSTQYRFSRGKPIQGCAGRRRRG